MKSLLESLAGREDVTKALVALRQLPPPALTDGQWERIDALSAVLPHAVAQLLALFAERDSLDHPAVAAAARDALGDESAPTGCLSLDCRIHHILVDEYQDVSSQERLLKLLVAGWQRRWQASFASEIGTIDLAFNDGLALLQAQRQELAPWRWTNTGPELRSSNAIVSG
jgi:ATP-dependent exoDNAse (exonuclease V) beta subunit